MNQVQRLRNLLENICDIITGYISNFDQKQVQNQINKNREHYCEDEALIKLYIVIKLKFSSSPHWDVKLNNLLQKLCATNQGTYNNIPTERTYNMISHIKMEGFPIHRAFDKFNYVSAVDDQSHSKMEVL